MRLKWSIFQIVIVKLIFSVCLNACLLIFFIILQKSLIIITCQSKMKVWLSTVVFTAFITMFSILRPFCVICVILGKIITSMVLCFTQQRIWRSQHRQGIKIFFLFDPLQAENTFLLALDGDVDFTPGAVRLLLDRMRKNPKVGAACGRIHPIGSGNYICILISRRGSPD